MKLIRLARTGLIVFLFLIEGVTMHAKASDIPVLIIPSDKPAEVLAETRKEQIIKLVRQHFRLDDPDSPYGQVKIEVIPDPASGLRHLLVYLKHREIYLVETVRLTIDKENKIIDINKSPL